MSFTVKGRKRYRTARLRTIKPPKLKKGYRATAIELRASKKHTGRDDEIINAVFTLGLLSRHQIQRMFWQEDLKSVSAVNDRLRTLFYRHVLYRTVDVSFEMERAGLVPCHVYTLGPTGEELLALDRQIKRSELSYKYSGRSSQNVMHDLMTAEIYVQAVAYAYTHERELVKAAKQRKLEKDAARRFITQNRLSMTWHGEHEAAIWQGDKELVRPDGVLEIEQGGERTLYFVELDRGHTKWEKKVNVYDNARQFGGWQSKFGINEYPHVLVIVPPNRNKRVAEAIAAHQPTVRYLIKEWPNYLAEPMSGWVDADGQNGSVSIGKLEQIPSLTS